MTISLPALLSQLLLGLVNGSFYAILSLGLGVLEGLTKVVYPEASATVVFVVMAIVLLLRPAGLFGKEH